ncbi:hypothetical protein HMPREF9336_02493 [Segniliparus rugosus ATCC BAA-974]|uniref:Intracellular septation protein A n=2 Tax=Segniliparus rugosus TaxID=286804 RepID=E5XSM1_SEGRC|nr:hypothetical protein HMPREF9336_02493 [Segniliparus rugosus ATCC BAA-974]
MLLQVLPVLAVYFGFRALGVEAYLALCAAVLFAVAHRVFDLIRGRTKDFLVLAIILFYAAGATITFFTHNPHYSQVANILSGAVISLFALVSALVGKPLTQGLTAKYSPGLAVRSLPERGWPAEDVRDYAALHRRVSLGCGLFGLAQTVVVLIVIFTCSVDVAQLVSNVAGTGVTALFAVYAVRRVRRFIAGRDEAARRARALA